MQKGDLMNAVKFPTVQLFTIFFGSILFVLAFLYISKIQDQKILQMKIELNKSTYVR